MKAATIPPPADPATTRRAVGAVEAEGPLLPFDGRRVSPAAVRDAVRWFAETPRGEEAFYVRFRALPADLRAALKRQWQTSEDWALFRRLCRLYGLRRQ